MKTFSERFWVRIDTNGPIPSHRPEIGPCWLWTGGHFTNGYGMVQVAGKKRKAHRVAYELVNGPIRDGCVACHECDNPGCVRPAHLFEGTHAQNIADRDAKGRTAHGERLPQTRLTDSMRDEIRRTHVPGSHEWGITGLARRYDLGTSTIFRVLKGVRR